MKHVWIRRVALVFIALALTLLPVCALAADASGASDRPTRGFIADLTQNSVVQNENYDPLEATLTLSGGSMFKAGACAASITLINQGDDVIGDVTICDAAGKTLWGPHDLDLSESYTWQGSLNVTNAMLSRGNAYCSVKYVLAKGDPQYQRTLEKPLAAALNRVSVNPAIEFSRSQSMTYAQPGQRVTLTYTIKNSGNVTLKNITVSDSLFGVVDTLPTLAIDEKKTFTKRVTVGATALTSKPSVKFSYEGSQDVIEKDIAAASIKIAQPRLEVLLESDATLVNPGDTVMLRCKLINNGNVGYKKIQLSDQVLGDLGFIDDLRAGKDTIYAKSVRIQAKTTFKFTITAKDTTGSDVTAISNSLSIDVVSKSDVASLTLSAKPDKSLVLNGEPVTFTLVLCNSGTADISGIDIAERTRGAIAHVDTLRAGESMPLTAQYNVTGYEMFTFSATMTQQDGATREALAGPITIALGAATPSPTPEPTPSPAPVITIAPTVLRAYDSVLNRVLTYLLAVSVCVAMVLLVVFGVTHTREKKRRRSTARRRGRHAPSGDTAHGKKRPHPQKAPDDDVKVYVPARANRPQRPPEPPKGRHSHFE